MKDTCDNIFTNKSLIHIEKEIAPVSEVFRLQDADELQIAEKVYLSQPVLEETVRYFIDPEEFYKLLASKGTTFYAGVPDSLLANFCFYVQAEAPPENHIITANEGSAIATASGHYLATGQIPCVYMQNSGLGNAVNPLLSLADQKLYKIPMLLMIGWRGQPGRRDEPQHLRMGEITPEMLKTMGIPYEILPDYFEGASKVIAKAYEYMEKERSPFALLITRATFTDYKSPRVQEGRYDIHREEAIRVLTNLAGPKDAFVATTGFASRELYEVREKSKEGHERDFLTIGSMGHASSIALGLAYGQPSRTVYCLDGDGAMVMHMGSMVTIAKSGLKGFKHVLLNNASHDSVGGQPTGLGEAGMVSVATSLGYRYADSVSQKEHLEDAIKRFQEAEGPAFLEIKLEVGTRSNLGRPTTAPDENKNEFMRFLGSKL